MKPGMNIRNKDFPAIILLIVLFALAGCKKATVSVAPATVTDVDGNIYNTVRIGSQVWMAENLNVTKYNDGTPIPNATDSPTWANLTSGAYTDYNNTPSVSATYGRLYNWYTVDDDPGTMTTSNGGKNVCPTGWHVPSDAEWIVLTTYLGGENGAGGKLKETGTLHWAADNIGATNETGFTALPGGYRDYTGYFGNLGYDGHWWTTTISSGTNAFYRHINFDYSDVYKVDDSFRYGFSVRCIMN
jgi:uncharacterized protein (TIGR02145 family)